MTERRIVDVLTPSYGWGHPWPNAFEIAGVFPTEHWTLVGGLMVQIHSLVSGISIVRPTDDLDMLLHIEIATGLPAEAARQLGRLGYALQPPLSRKAPAYRFTRDHDVIDVMAADHAAPSRRETLRSSPMFAVDGGTQALQRTMICVVTDADGSQTRFSVPDELGALVLKAAAYIADARDRDRDRHLFDVLCWRPPSPTTPRNSGGSRGLTRSASAHSAPPSTTCDVQPGWHCRPSIDSPARTRFGSCLRLVDQALVATLVQPSCASTWGSRVACRARYQVDVRWVHTSTASNRFGRG